MNWEAIGAVGEILGAIAVFGSLMYLAMQIRTSNILSRIEGRERGNEAYDRFRTKMLQDDRLEDLIFRGGSDLSSLDDQERRKYQFLVGEIIVNLRVQYMRAYDLKNDEEIGRVEEICEIWAQRPGFREVGRTAKPPLERPYADMLERVMGNE